MNSPQTTLAPATIEAVQSIVATTPQLVLRGGGTKAALSQPRPGWSVLELCRLRGILDYEPGEYTFTALAGTPLAEVEAALAQNGQYLPFDPPFAAQGATLGGTVAAGLSGPGRQRYGGVRDFLIGVRFVDGRGRLVRGGGKVVKNAAGFDLPKLMVGSLGTLSALVEVSFKVFPQPPAYGTLRAEFADLPALLAGAESVAAAPLDLEAFDLVVGRDRPYLLARLGGLAGVLPERLARLQAAVGAGEPLTDEAEAQLWAEASAFAWVPDGAFLVKVPITPGRIAELDARLAPGGAVRRYSGGAQAWIAWPAELPRLHALLNELDLPGLVLFGQCAEPLIGAWRGRALYRRIKATLDPSGRFPEIGESSSFR